MVDGAYVYWVSGGFVDIALWFYARISPFFHASGRSGQSEIILGVLSLIDLSLSGNLLLIVIFSGYENFVSKMSTKDHEDQQEWHGTVDFATLKLKLVASMVAISGIHLLQAFMDVEKIDDNKIQWMVIIHLIFVISGVLLALMDRIAVSSKLLKEK